jgi:hypothetical protein
MHELTNVTETNSPIALFTRQKLRSRNTIWLTLLCLTVIHGIQLVALYNYNSLSGVILTESINDYVERAYWIPNNLSISGATPGNELGLVRAQFGGSEVQMIGVMTKYGYCLSPIGYYAQVINIVIGMGFVYLFIFADVWKVIFNTTITKNFPDEPNFKLCLFGAFWLVCLNAAILTWLGVESGFSVVASSGDFYNVLFNSLSIFIILSLDETILPLVRFFLEDWGHLNAQGELSEARLDQITHGGQYHKPGYGIHWGRNLTQGAFSLRLVAFLSLVIAMTIVVAPLGVSIDYATKSLVKC